MPIIKPRSKKKREEQEALKMADGGVVKPKTLGEIIGYPKRMAQGGVVEKENYEEQQLRLAQEQQKKREHNESIDENESSAIESAKRHRYAFGGLVDDEDEEMSIAQSIRSRRMDKIQPEDPVEPLEPEYDELNESAGDDSVLNPSEGEDDYDKQNRIAAIRRKRLRGYF